MVGRHLAWAIATSGFAFARICAPAGAANKTYIGAAGFGTWSVGSLWSPVGAPQNGDNCFLTPTDANTREVTFGGTPVGVFSYGAVTVHSTGAGSITLVNNATFPATAQFPAQSLTVGTRGIYRQNPGTTATVVSTVISSSGTITNNNGTYYATDITQSGGFTFGGAWVISNRYSLQAGQIHELAGVPPQITNNGTFEMAASTVAHCDLVNNGTFIYHGGLFATSEVLNHGTIIANVDLRLGSLKNMTSMSMPAGPSLAAFAGITQGAGTFSQSNDIMAPVTVAGGVWHQLDGILTHDGTATTVGTLTVGADGSPGTFLLSGGNVHSRPIHIGAANSSGTFLQTAGIVHTSEPIRVGATPQNFATGGRGFYSISGGSITANSLIVGATDALAGTFTQSGGRVSVGSLIINQNLASSGAVTISGGTFVSSQGAANNDLLTQSGGVSSLLRIDGAGRLSVTGTGMMTAQHGIRQDSVQLGGSARLTTSQTTPTPTNRVRALSFEETGPAVHGTWDLGRGALVVDYAGPSPVADIQRYLRRGYASGSWTGTGLTSSAAQANPATIALGYGESSQILGPAGGVFQGVVVDSSAVLVKLARYGDANLDGTVNLSDFNRLAASFGSTAATWAQGDFTYDGIVNLADFNRLAANFGLSASADGPTPVDWSALAGAVPEPSAGFAVMALLCPARRRARRRDRSSRQPAGAIPVPACARRE